MEPEPRMQAAPAAPGGGVRPWPKTDRPLRVAMLGWARLSAQQAEGSGYNLSASELAAGLALSGHSVAYLRSGMDYSPRPGMRIRRMETWRGVRCDTIVNSPNLAISRFNFSNTEREISTPAQTRLVLSWLDEVRAHILHIHSLEGFSLDLVKAVSATGRPVVVTPHNYWYVCPQVDLLARETEVCLDYDGGRRCVDCLPPTDPAKERRRRALRSVARAALGPNAARLARETLGRARAGLGALLRSPPPPDLPGPPLDPELAADPSLSGPSLNGLAHAPARASAPEWSEPDANERLLRGDRHLVVLNEYGRRRAAGLEALSHASLLLGPSRYLMEVLAAMGFDRSKTRFVPYGQPHFDAINRATRRSEFYAARPWSAATACRPLRLGFLGTTFPNKGLEVLVRAIELLDEASRRRCHFLIWAYGDDSPFRARLATYPEVSFRGAYQTADLPGLLREFDVGILPHIWLENAPLVMFEMLNAGKMIIASRLGGVVDFLHEGRGGKPGNAAFFAGGSAEGLAARIEEVARGEGVVPSAREVHEASDLRSYRGHVEAVEACYREVLPL